MGEKWDIRFLNLAKEIASWSKDPSTKVGAVIVGPNREIVSAGYNGFPMGVQDLEERLVNREIKYNLIAHAERNALDLGRGDMTGCTIYIYPLSPCHECMKSMIQKGIGRVVSIESSSERWFESFEIAQIMAEEAGIHMTTYREDSL